MATRAIRLPAGSGGETSYTLQPGEYFQLVSVVGQLDVYPLGTALVPTIVVESPGVSVIAEVSAATATV